MARTDVEQLREVERKINRLTMRKARIEKRMRDKERRADTRRKLVAGEYAYNTAEYHPDFAAKFYAAVDDEVLEHHEHLFDGSELNRREMRQKLIVAGAVALGVAEVDEEFAHRLHWALNKYLEKDKDRALFDLPPLEDAKAVAPEKSRKGPGAGPEFTLH